MRYKTAFLLYTMYGKWLDLSLDSAEILCFTQRQNNLTSQLSWCVCLGNSLKGTADFYAESSIQLVQKTHEVITWKQNWQ